MFGAWGMGKRVRQRKVDIAASPPASPPSPPSWRIRALWAFGVSGWIASLLLGILELPAKIVSFASNAPGAREVTGNFLYDYKLYEGRFSSDPGAWTESNLISDGTPQGDTGDIQLSIEYIGNGRYRGEIHSAHMAKNFFAPWSRVM